MGRYRCHVISNTHWDREWRYPFQAYRMDLVEMMDRLLDLMERREDYRAFYLDSQTVILEDYLEIRPENEERIRRLAQAGRLQIGPWYTLPDQWLCPGEALVRNLLMGHRTARLYGPVAKVGYTPFSNGQISQLPQLYRGFGIDSCFFYRGVGKHVAKSEFLWEGADGSRVFAFRFGDYARYNYYYLVYRPGLLGRSVKDRTYKWDPAETPYHVANEQSQDRQYGWMAQRLFVREERLDQALAEALEFTAADATTGQLLYMMGHDHSFAAEEELALIEALRARGGAKGEVIHSSLTDYLEAFRAEAKDLAVLTGEMRHTNKIGLWTNLMAMILSCRLYLKQRNADVCRQILGGAEPLAAMAWMTGSPYPGKYLEIAWKKILVNQAHDAIGGCSVDRVHEEMLARWGEVETISDELCRRAMRDLVSRIDGSGVGDARLQLTVFNTLPFERSGLGAFTIDIPADLGHGPFRVETLDGEPVETQVDTAENYNATIEGGYELSLELPLKRHRALLALEAIPAMGYKTLVIRPGEAPPRAWESIVQSERELENRHLRVWVNDNGTARLTDKRTGRVYHSLGFLEDTAEFGDPWNRVTPPGDAPIYSLDRQAKVTVERSGPLAGSLRARFTLSVPAGRSAEGKRSQELVELPVSILYTLEKDATQLLVTLTVENRAKDHRLRVLFPTGLAAAEYSWSEGQFDVLRRPIARPSPEGWKEPPYPTNPMWNFVDVFDGEKGFAVLNDGLTEYEVIEDSARTIAITLLRAFGKFVYARPTPGSQCLGEHTYRFALIPHEGCWRASELPRRTAEFLTPFQAVESAPTRGALPPERSFLRLDPPGALVLSGVKRGEDGESLIVRFWNPSEEVTVEGALTFGSPAVSAEWVTLEELPEAPAKLINGREVAFSAPPKKILTLRARMKQ